MLIGKVDLIDKHQLRNGTLGYGGEKLGVLARILHHIGYVEQEIGILQGLLHRLQHGTLQLVGWRQYTRGIGVNNLVVWGIDNAKNSMAGSLRLAGDYGQPLTHQTIHECGFPNVRISENADKT